MTGVITARAVGTCAASQLSSTMVIISICVEQECTITCHSSMPAHIFIQDVKYLSLSVLCRHATCTMPEAICPNIDEGIMMSWVPIPPCDQSYPSYHILVPKVIIFEANFRGASGQTYGGVAWGLLRGYMVRQ